MIKFNALLFLVSLTIFLSCDDKPINSNSSDVISNPEFGSLQNSENPPFSFELVEEINLELPEDYILSGIANLMKDEDGNFYFLDYLQNKLISVDGDGKTRWITGEKGRGPGDFENAYTMTLSNDGLVIGNLQGTRLDYFNFNGNFIKSIDLGKELSFGGLSGKLSTGELVISSALMGKIGTKISIINVSNDSLSLVNSFEIDFTEELKIPQGMSIGGSIQVLNDKIIAGSNINYVFEIYNSKGERELTVERDFEKLVAPGVYSSGGTSSIRSFGGITSPIETNGLYIARATWPTNVSNPNDYVTPDRRENLPSPAFSNSLDFYDENWNLLYSMESEGMSPNIGYIRKVDDSDFLFTTQTDPTPTIKKYALRMPDN